MAEYIVVRRVVLPEPRHRRSETPFDTIRSALAVQPWFTELVLF